MNIKYDKDHGEIFCSITKNLFVHSYNEWNQMRGKWNWYSFTFLHVYFENDNFTGGWEFEFYFLGVGFRIRYNYEDGKVNQLVKYETLRTKKGK